METVLTMHQAWTLVIAAWIGIGGIALGKLLLHFARSISNRIANREEGYRLRNRIEVLEEDIRILERKFRKEGKK